MFGSMENFDIGYKPLGAAANPLSTSLRGTTTLGSSPSGSTSGIGGLGGFGMNLDTLGVAVQGLGTIGSLWNAFQAQKLARKQFEFSKSFAEKNLANQIQSYNTTLADRGRSRAVVEGQSSDEAAAYIRDNSLSK